MSALPSVDHFGVLYARDVWPCHHLDDLGRCCGRKPLTYKRDKYRVCLRCGRAYHLEENKQIENWSWKQVDDGFVMVTPHYPVVYPDERFKR